MNTPTAAEIRTLNNARTLLEKLEARADHNTRAAEAADRAAYGIFRYLNIVNSYGGANLSYSQLHNGVS